MVELKELFPFDEELGLFGDKTEKNCRKKVQRLETKGNDRQPEEELRERDKASQVKSKFDLDLKVSV